MPTVTVEFSAEELESLDRWILRTDGGGREEAVIELLDEWLDRRSDGGLKPVMFH